MIFNFAYSNIALEELRSLPELVMPVVDGLVENGHHVIRFAAGVRPPPAVNVLIEGFTDDGFTDGLLRLKSERGVLFGILCAADIEDNALMAGPDAPRRGANLRRLLPAADFVWTLLPQVTALERAGAAGKAVWLRLGFTPRALNPDLVTEPGLRGLDAVLHGADTPYRLAIVEELRQRGINCFRTNQLAFPPNLVADLLSRAKVVLDIGAQPGRRFESSTRLTRALHSGAIVLAEQLPDEANADLQRFAVSAPYSALAERCQQIVQSGLFAELGLAALAGFRKETSMRDRMAAALRLPVFERLAQA